MPFTLQNLEGFFRGTWLAGQPNRIPEGTLRRTLNARVDRIRGSITGRPGIRTLTNTAVGGTILWLSKLFTPSGSQDRTFSHSSENGGTLTRFNQNWDGPATLLTGIGVDPLTDVNAATGKGDVYKYMVNATTAVKTVAGGVTTMGIAAPTALPTVSLATDLETIIDDCENSANWTLTENLDSGPSNSTTKIRGTNSQAFSFAASTQAAIGRMVTVDLDTLAGGDDDVKADDYIHIWIRVDRPERLVYFQIDFDVDADTTTTTNAFLDNFYSVRLDAFTSLSQGRDQWNKIQVRKAEFARYGTDTDRDWGDVVAVRLSFRSNELGVVNIRIDDFKLRGGFGIEGEMEYTAVYQRTDTGARGNPYMIDGVVQYTDKLTVDRQAVILGLALVCEENPDAVYESGTGHPGDDQINKVLIYRKGGTFSSAVLVGDRDDTAGTITLPPGFTDDVSDATLILDPKPLETDNDMPPTGTVRRIFGPDAAGHYFMLVDEHKLYFSKPFELDENRVENWPEDNYALIGDGSQKALIGVAQDANVFVFTDESTYFVQGVGADTFLPIHIPNSRGTVGPMAVTSGDGRIFFVADDGIYEQIDMQQRKLTFSVDPFFNEETVDGQEPWHSTAAKRALVVLQWHGHPLGAYVRMLYCTADSDVPDRSLIVKKNPETGQYTEVFFDKHTPALRSLYYDYEANILAAGATDGHVYETEREESGNDNGTDFQFLARTRSEDQGLPWRKKTYSSFGADMNTRFQSLTFTAYYDNNSESEGLGTINTQGVSRQTLRQTSNEETKRENVSLEVSGNLIRYPIIDRFAIHAMALPESRIFHDSDEISFPTIHELRKVLIDAEFSGDRTLGVYTGGVKTEHTITGNGTRQVFTVEIPLGKRSKVFRFTLDGEMELYAWSAEWRPEPEDVTIWDSDEVPFANVSQGEGFVFEVDAPADISTSVYVDGRTFTGTVFATTGREIARYYLPPGVKGYEWRVNMESVQAFQLWSALGKWKTLGTNHGYQPRTLLARRDGRVMRDLTGG